jgi:hypothetical protein
MRKKVPEVQVFKVSELNNPTLETPGTLKL